LKLEAAVKLTLAAIAAVLICLLSLAARSYALRAAERARPFEEAYAAQEKLALAAIDGHLRSQLQKLAKR
jgi:hypothetical protein